MTLKLALALKPMLLLRRALVCLKHALGRFSWCFGVYPGSTYFLVCPTRQIAGWVSLDARNSIRNIGCKGC